MPLDRQSLVAHLKRAGLDPSEEVCEIQMKHYVKYAGPLAGRPRGLVERWVWFFWRERVRRFRHVPTCKV